ncbi:hypothetical protein SK128_000895 [Halocaridina rubra]|uniref:Ankyrin repeat protein n=1 Tax=Halocaridina rubra TaxID=373956 RepID=A0AAN8XPM6_HALRR
MSELNKKEKDCENKASLRNVWNVVKEEVKERVEEERGCFKEEIVKCAESVCGRRPIGGSKGKLIAAIAENKESSVKEAIEKGANINYEGPGGARPLHLAVCKNGFYGIVSALLERGAEVNITDEEGFTPLMVAALNGHSKVVRLLLEKGANPNTTRLDTGETALHLAMNSNSMATARVLLDFEADIGLRTSNEGLTPLHFAAEFGSRLSVEAILRHPLTETEHVIAKDNNGQTASEVALSRNFIDLAHRLDVMAVPYSPTEKQMIDAVLSSDLDKLHEALSSGADPNLITPRGDRILHTAAMNGNCHIIRQLVQKGSDIDVADSEGYTAMMIAALNNKLEAVIELCNHGANLKVIRTIFNESEDDEGLLLLLFEVKANLVLARALVQRTQCYIWQRH